MIGNEAFRGSATHAQERKPIRERHVDTKKIHIDISLGGKEYTGGLYERYRPSNWFHFPPILKPV